MLTKRFDEAFKFAHDLHRTQTRKGTSIPYISHLLAVSAIVIENGGDEDQAIGALLHDAAEKGEGKKTLGEIERRFGNSVAEIVSDCTDSFAEPKPGWRSRKEIYLAKLPATAPQSQLVSLADKIQNAEVIALDYQNHGDTIWQRYEGGAEGMRWYYSALASRFARLMPGPLSDRLGRAVAEIRLSGPLV
jgi:(p)ppGpp synthase/HD superfamily hydrolase